MKFPKLKHTVLCELLLFLPGMTIFFWIILCFAVAGQEKVNPVFVLGTMFLAAGISLWYLLRNYPLLLVSEVLFHQLRQWKLDRTEYRTRCNGIGQAAIRRAILRRCGHWGRQQDGGADIAVFFRHHHTLTRHWSVVEKRVAVCTADTLTPDQYRALTNQARYLLSTVPDGKPYLKTRRERRAPRAYADVIVILANTVPDQVKALARKPLVKEEGHFVLPCVVQCTDGCYYTDCTTEFYQQGMFPRPARSYAAFLLRKLVFSRHLPKENAAAQPAPDFAYAPEMSLWAYCRAIHREFRGAKDEQKADRVKACRHMKSGEVRIGDGVVWYKSGNRLAEYPLLADENDENLVTLLPDRVWYYEKNPDRFLTFLFGTDLNRRRMKNGESEQVQARMEAKLKAEGYRIAP